MQVYAGVSETSPHGGISSKPMISRYHCTYQRKKEIKAPAYTHDTRSCLFSVEKVSMKAGAEGRTRGWHRREMPIPQVMGSLGSEGRRENVQRDVELGFA